MEFTGNPALKYCSTFVSASMQQTTKIDTNLTILDVALFGAPGVINLLTENTLWSGWPFTLQTLQLNFIRVVLGKLQGKGVTQFSVLNGGGFLWRIE